MIGIKGYGAYIPIYRLKREEINRAWKIGGIGGERSVAGYDEDSLTMATEAVFDLLYGRDVREEIEALFFASTTHPYREKECAPTIGFAADLRKDIHTADFANSLRSATQALRQAFCEVSSGLSKEALVVASDKRPAKPRTVDEQMFGDGAAAILLGKGEDIICEIEGFYSCYDEIVDVWRKDNDDFVRSWEGRWVIHSGYNKRIKEAVEGLLERISLKPSDFSKIVLYTPDRRAHTNIARTLGFDPKMIQDPLLDVVGNTGCAQVLILLAAALEEAKAGDRILVASYGNGADAISLKVTENIGKFKPKRGVKGHVESKMILENYERYLAYKSLITLPEEMIRLFPSASVMHRTRSWVTSLHGSKCKNCGLVTFPIQRVCYGCGARDNYEEVRLSDKEGKVFSFSIDRLAGGVDAYTVQTIVETHGGARIYCLMTDCVAEEIDVDTEVEMTFRKFHDVGGFYNYFWKCRPRR